MKRWFRDSALRGLVRKSGYLVTSRAAAGVLGLTSLSLATHALGTAQFGILILIHAYATAASSFVKFQSSQVVIHFGAPALRANDVKQLQHGISFAMGLDLSSGLLGMVVAIAALPLIGPWFHIDGDVLVPAMIYCTVLPTMAAATPTGVLRLFDRIDLLVWQLWVTPALRVVLSAIAWQFDLGFPAFLVTWYLTDLVGDLVLWVLTVRELRERGILRGMRIGLWRHTRYLKDAWRFAFIANLTASLAAGWGPVANLLVGGLLGPVAAGQYRVAAGVVNAANKPADMLAKNFYPEVVRLDLSTRQPWKLMFRGAILSGLVGLLIVLLVLVAGDTFIREIFGAGFEPAATLLMMMAFGLIVTMIAFPLTPMCYAVHRPGVPLRARLVATTLYVIAIVPFTRWWGLNGAGAAYVVCMTLLALQMVPPLLGEYRRRHRLADHAV